MTHCQTWCGNQILSLWQWAICGQFIPTDMPTKQPATYLLGHECAHLKWHCRACHPWPLWECQKAAIACPPAMTGGSAHSFTALRNRQHSTTAQHSANAKRWHILVWAFQLNSSWCKNGTQPHFCMPSLYFAKWTTDENSIPKWSPRAHLGLNLGPSPMHARNVYLVLNLSTGLVSPLFHCCFDDFFETTKYGGPDVAM